MPLRTREDRLSTKPPSVPHIVFYSHSGTPAYLSLQDADLASYVWYLDSHGRLRRTEWDFVNKKTLNIQLHKIVWARIKEDNIVPMVDHEDGNPSNNTRENLRKSNFSENGMNRFNAKGYRMHNNKYVARFKQSSKTFILLDDAIAWRNNKIAEFWQNASK